MKKLLALFVALDFIFVGLILKFTASEPLRMISSVNNSAYNELTEGQKNKWHLVESLKFQISPTELILETDKLQMICETSQLIELHFYAQNVAFAGVRPRVTHTFSCAPIKNFQSQTKLSTPIAEFQTLHKLKRISLLTSELLGAQLFADEEFPISWKLAEVTVRGPNTFTINEHEIEKVHASSFTFTLISAK